MKSITLLLLFSFATAATAVEPTKLALIREVLELIDAQGALEKMRVDNVQQAKALMVANAGAQANDPIGKRIIEKAGIKYEAYSKEFMGWKKWESDYIAMYDEFFTEPELKGLVGFYKTPAGKATIRALPEIGLRMQKRMFEQGTEIEAKIASIIRQSINEVRAEEAMK